MREALLGVAVGKKGIGKTFTTLQIINNYVKGSSNIAPRRALILDVNDEFENIKAIKLTDVSLFCMHPKIEARRIRPFNANGSKMTLDEIAMTLLQILETFRGGLLLIEDLNKYISDHLPKDLIGAICTNRHSSTDIILHFQSIGRISPKVWANINFLRFHKNTDSVDRHKPKFEDKYEAFKICELLINKQYFSGNTRFFITFDCDSEKIYGTFTKNMIEEAIDDYIALNYNKKIKPLMNMRGVNGKSKYTSISAVAELKKMLYKSYVG